jgi:peptide/nickel transport system permease protein
MGKLTVDAIFQRDWPVVYTVLMLAAVLTMSGILVADILYATVDPRVSYGKDKN